MAYFMGLHIPGPGGDNSSKWTYGDGIAIARGEELDSLARMFGIKRRRYLLVFRESDKNLRKRCMWLIREIDRNNRLESQKQHDLMIKLRKTT